MINRRRISALNQRKRFLREQHRKMASRRQEFFLNNAATASSENS